MQLPAVVIAVFFFVDDAATTEIYTLSLHDALPIWGCPSIVSNSPPGLVRILMVPYFAFFGFRSEGTRLNSSHSQISYAVFCLKKKKPKHGQHVKQDTRQKNTHLPPDAATKRAVQWK